MLPLFAQAAEDINFPHDSHLLAPDPIATNIADSLFPSLTSLTGNTVTITSGTISGYVYGGVTADAQEVSGNSITISGGSIGPNINGGYSRSGNATGNSVTLSGGSMRGYIIGGNSYSGNVARNRVIISGGSVNYSAYGGYSSYGSATNNSVIMSGGLVRGNVIGSYSGYDNATANNVIISGGTVDGDVDGGVSIYHSATGNSVTIAGTGSVNGNIYGGYSYYGTGNDTITNNWVSISGTPTFSATSSLYGGSMYRGNCDTFTGNTLIFSAAPVSVDKVANFEHYRFTIDPNLANKATALITAQEITLGNSSGTPSTIAIAGIHSGSVLHANDTFILMQADNMTGNVIGQSWSGTARQGISLLYDIKANVNFTNNQVMATILPTNSIDNGGDGDSDGNGSNVDGGDVDNAGVGNDGSINNDNGSARINPQLKALPEGRLSGLMLVTRGADAIANDLNATIGKQNRYGLVPFVMLTAGSNRYNSGSHIKSNDTLLAGGLSYRQTDYTIAAFVESGWGNYDSYNSFTNAANVYGDGSTHYVGGGLFGRYEFGSGVYAEASLRAGQSRSKFDTADIRNLATGEAAHYNLKNNYISAHAGAGYLWALSDADTFNVSAKYLWSRIGGKNAIISGDSFHFDSINSQRLRINSEFSHRHSDSLTLSVGLGYEYEFDTKSKATTYDAYQVDTPTLKGSTSILSLGATFTPATNRNLSLDVGAQGYIGKREGGSVAMRVNYAF